MFSSSAPPIQASSASDAPRCRHDARSLFLACLTSLARSVAHQRHLRSLGYLAPLPSAHCVGSAIDIEMAWYRRFRAHRILRGLILDRQRADEVNVIDEGQAWHVCLRPGTAVRAA